MRNIDNGKKIFSWAKIKLQTVSVRKEAGKDISIM